MKYIIKHTKIDYYEVEAKDKDEAFALIEDKTVNILPQFEGKVTLIPEQGERISEIIKTVK